MWPWKRRITPIVEVALDEQIAELRAFAGIGETFELLGVTFLVVGHWENVWFGIHDGVKSIAKLRCLCANRDGGLKGVSFSLREVGAMAAQRGLATK